MNKDKINPNKERQVLDCILAIDLSPIKVKLAHSKGWTLEYSTEVEKWYKRFLFLSYKFSEHIIVVNNVIDEFWHNHILDTRKYIEDCNIIFGKYLHHFPYFGMRGDEDKKNLIKAFEETNRLFFEEFGETEMKTATTVDGIFNVEENIKF